MKFLLDANIPHSAKTVFKQEDTVLHVHDIDLADASDETIIGRAKKERVIFITVTWILEIFSSSLLHSTTVS